MNILLKSIIIICLPFLAFSQANYVKINSGINLPKDSIVSKQLIVSLDQFLIDSQIDNEKNKFVNELEKNETYIQLDEIKNIQKNKKLNDNNFYKPYLTNVSLIDTNQYLVQISYIGIHENNAYLAATFEFIAKKDNTVFKFSSPLLKNTKNWKSLKIENYVFYYKDFINKQMIKQFVDKAQLFDKKLLFTNKTTKYYLCDNLLEMQRLIGINYKINYNGLQNSNTFFSMMDNQILIMLYNDNPFLEEYILHDLWHDTLSLKVSTSNIYKPVDEACAYLYGGSWDMTWKEIYQKFKQKVASNKNIDWKEIKENPLNFGDSKEKHLMADYVVTALIIQKLEKEKGFSAVWELLNCGKREKGNANYYKSLEIHTGITKDDYNQKVWELISNED